MPVPVETSALRALSHVLGHDADGYFGRQTVGDLLRHSPLVTPRVGMIGHSKVEQNNFGNRHLAHGFMTWARFLTGQRFDYAPSLNFGISGQKSEQIRERTAAILDANPTVRVWVVQAFTNDVASTGFVDSLATGPQIQKLFTDRGLTLIWLTDDPRGDANVPTARLPTSGARNLLQQAFDTRRWLLDQRGVQGVFVVDTWDLLADPTSTTGDAAAGLLYDGLHEAQTGAYRKGLALARVLRHLFAPRSILPAANGDVFGPGGLRSQNPYFGGTGGSIGAGNTGGLADGWSAFSVSAAGVTLAFSKPAATSAFNGVPYDGGHAKGNWQQVSVSGMATNASEVTLFSQSLGNIGVGDAIQAVGEIEIDPGLTGFVNIGLFLYDSASNTRHAADMDNTSAIFGMPMPGGVSGVLRTPKWTVDATANKQIRLMGKLIAGSPVSLTLRARGVAAL